MLESSPEPFPARWPELPKEGRGEAAPQGDLPVGMQAGIPASLAPSSPSWTPEELQALDSRDLDDLARGAGPDPGRLPAPTLPGGRARAGPDRQP